MPTIRRPGRARGPRIVVLGDLVLDVVLAPARQLAAGSDVPGRVAMVQGGSAANTARWAARIGARSSLISAVGRDATGRALVAALRADGVVVHVSRIAGARTGRIGVLVAPGGERSFVQDRGAAELLAADELRASWFSGADVVHLPIYSLLGAQGAAGRRALELGRAAGAAVSVDLASIGPLLAGGRPAARALVRDAGPDVLFATAAEAEALLGLGVLDGLLELASIVVVKRGPKGATVLARDGAGTLRFEAATEALSATDTTGAGDAFDAGFLVGWLTARAAGRSISTSLHRAALAGHRAAARQLSTPRPELALG
ncbi:MAG TPA: carbohydrate kinase family protein [Candidatus Limnocylindrales bacterium]|jgi:sugar/nucleoside kinase (ribokinase family)